MISAMDQVTDVAEVDIVDQALRAGEEACRKMDAATAEADRVCDSTADRQGVTAREQRDRAVEKRGASSKINGTARP